jgi:hypothetical protein
MRLLLPPPPSPPLQPRPPQPAVACPALGLLGAPSPATEAQPPLPPSLTLPQAIGLSLANVAPALPVTQRFSAQEAYAAGAAAAAAVAAAHIGSPVSAHWGYPLAPDHAGGHHVLSESVPVQAQQAWEWSPASGGILSHSPPLYTGGGCCFSPPIHH